MPLCRSSSLEHQRIVLRLDHDRDVGVVLGGGADHGRAADVDVLDAGVEAGALGDGLLERIEVDHQEVDRPDAVRRHRGGVLRVVANGEQTAVDERVQRLHPAVHHLGKAGELGHVEHAQPGVGEGLARAAGGDEFDAVAAPARGRNRRGAILSETDKRARDIRRR